MNYEEAEISLGKDRQYSYYDRYTYIKRRDGYIAIDQSHLKDLVKFYPDGRIEIYIETPDKLQDYQPARSFPEGSSKINISYQTRSLLNGLNLGYYFYPASYHTCMTKGKNSSDANIYNGWEMPERILIDKDKNIISQTPEKSITYKEISAHYRRQNLIRENRRRRGRFWQSRVRNLYLDRSKCTQRDKNLRFSRCDTRGYRRYGITGPREFSCGCRVYRKEIKFRYTAKRILDEPNATVRACMIKLYGVDKFFTDAKATSIAELEDYRLLELNLPTTSTNQELNKLRALQMVCPSTKQTYVNLVPNDVPSIPLALDWMFDTTNYLDRVKQAT